MKKALIILFLAGLFTSASFSQQDTPILQNQKVEPVQLSPTFIVADVATVYNKLETVEIRGAEVDVFLQIKKKLTQIIEAAQKKQLKAQDTVEVDLELPMAQSILNLMDRAVLQGSEAESFQRFRQAIIDSAKKLQDK